MTTVFADNYGFSAEDATSALQDAINDPNADTIVVRNTETPWLISRQIELRSNKEIIFEEGVVVQAKPGSFLANDRAMFVGLNIENIKLIGQGSGENKATLKMNKEEYNSNEFGHVVSLLGVDGYEVSGLKLTGGGGDGLHLAAGSFERPDPNLLPYSANGLIENITSDNNRRQGLSIDSARNLVVRNSTFTNTSGTEPSAGINLEPTWDFEGLENIRIENVEISGNAGNGIQMTLGNLDNNSRPISVDFNNITLNDSRTNAIFITGKYIAQGSEFGTEFKGEPNQSIPNADIDGTINFNNVNISNSTAIANSGNPGNNPETYVFVEGISGNQDDPNNLAVNFSNLNVNDSLDTTVRTTPIFIQGLGGNNNPQEIGNLSFNDVTVQGNYSIDVIRADLGRADGNLNNVSGNITVFNPNGANSFFENIDQAENFSLNIIEGNGQTLPPEIIEEELAVEPSIPVELEIESIEEEIALEIEPITENLPTSELIEEEVVGENSAPVVISNEATPLTETNVRSIDINNADFSNNLESWNIWRENINVVERSEGDRWVKIDSAMGGIGQDVTEQIASGEDYQVSATTKLSELNTRGYIGVRFATESNELLDLQYVEVNNTTEQNLQFDFTAPEEFARVEVFAYKDDGSAALFVDDFSFNAISDEATSSESSPPAIVETETVETSELNADFEESLNFASIDSEIIDSESSTSVAESAPREFSPEPIVNSIQINNASFTDQLTGWNPSGGDISVVERSEGDPWARINSAVGGISQDVTNQLAPANDYQISAIAKLSEAGTRGYVGVRFTTETNELVDLKFVQLSDNTAQERQLDFTSPETFARAEVFAFKNDGSAALFVDDFSLIQQG